MDPLDANVDRIKQYLLAAEELKGEGNNYFRARKWNEALVAYRAGLGHLPKRKNRAVAPTQAGNGTQTEVGLDDDEPTSSERADESHLDDDISEELQPEWEECAKARAVLNANIGACYVKLDDHKEAVAACTQALLDDPQYIKALQRRATSNEKINSWSSLTHAQEDYNTLLTLLPSSSAQHDEARRSLRMLQPRVEAAQQRETAEMMDKLKGLGNSLLGNFGLSLDNFKMEPNGNGGYSMNFSR